MFAEAYREAARIRRVAAAHGRGAVGELNVVPFLDVVMNVLIFVLLSMSIDAAGTVQTAQRRSGRGDGAPPVPEVVVSARGVHVRLLGRWLGPGCARFGDGAPIASVRAGSLDRAALQRCLAQMRAAAAWRAALAGQRQVAVRVDPRLPYAVVIDALDGVRELRPGARDLYPEPLLDLGH
ncbi:MAG: biopolymer transporter ExbD [Polyangiales bacterium]